MYRRIKKREAPFMCIIRVIQPVLMSCIIFTMEVKASLASELYIMDTTSPVTICSIRVIPSKKPMFHRNEIDVGVGRSRRDDLIILRIGSFFIFWGFILECGGY